ncbi:MAG: hypothetical protein ABUL44_00145 [Flavobacterium sp.]
MQSMDAAAWVVLQPNKDHVPVNSDSLVNMKLNNTQQFVKTG